MRTLAGLLIGSGLLLASCSNAQFVTNPDASAGDAATGSDATTEADAGTEGDAGRPDGPRASTYELEVRADGPAAYFRFGEAAGTPLARDEIAQRDGTYSNVTLGGVGAVKNDTAADFNGTTSQVSLGDVFGFEGTVAHSIEVWLNPRSIDSGYRCITCKETRILAKQQGHLFWLHSSGMTFERFDLDGGLDLIVAPNPPTNAWSHVVFTYDGAVMRLYTNGVETVPAVPSTRKLPKVLVDFIIGGGEGTFNGGFDELAIYDKALPGARVRAHFTAAK